MNRSSRFNINALIYSLGVIAALIAVYWWIFRPFQRLLLKEQPAKIISSVNIEPHIACTDGDLCVITDGKYGFKTLIPSTGTLQVRTSVNQYIDCAISEDGTTVAAIGRGFFDLAEITSSGAKFRQVFKYPKNSEGEMPIFCFLPKGGGAVFGANLMRIGFADPTFSKVKLLNFGDHRVLNIVRDPQDKNCVIVLTEDAPYRIDSTQEKIVEQLALVKAFDISANDKTIAIRTKEEVLSGPALSKLNHIKIPSDYSSGRLIRMSKSGKIAIDNFFGVQILDQSLNYLRARWLNADPLYMDFSGENLVIVRNEIKIFR